MSVEPGQPAPDFTLPRDGGGEITLSDLKGKQVVLYFYPKDDTSGCTKEAIAFTEHLDAFEAANATVIGLSKDTVAKHDKFRDKHGLKVALVSDEDGAVCEAYGTWVEKSMYGKKYMGIERATFLIGEDGTVKQVWRKVKVPGHAEAVLDAVKA
ncbi:thioredoxin-dependent thiol peroxidase [Jannaschia aquimarina]|uniref:thioredoxin-dependent peroxiredoxin n=1 Tax=Jannaschia aquimarina TaxID=935700 RepID=A0A0D1DB59_9RHOB|nr:thioredoxin-dependent thiol peroxidase [Jannaschia aquimarina]KIT17183.1 putative peroxiredoxin bcp [Jannaschia aquimarina]SNT17974.1 peroxiredoxin Q/BCP [Jannaschia aquimarina]